MSTEDSDKKVSVEEEEHKVAKNTTVAKNNKRPRSSLLADSFSRYLYQLIVKQLHNDGLLAAAAAVADASSVTVPSLEQDGNRLSELVTNGLSLELQELKEVEAFRTRHVVEKYLSSSKLYMPDSHSRSWAVGRKKFKMRERFSTSSLGGVVRDISFSSDGSLVSCVGTNGLCVIFSLETLEDLTALNEVRAAVVARSLDGNSERSKNFNYSLNDVSELAVARQFTEHTQSVEVMRFHPSRPIVLSGGHDGDVYVRDYSQPNTKILWHIHDSFPIRSAAFHPTGEYVLVGTDHVVPRLINIQTGATLTTPDAVGSGNEESNMKHSGGITSVGFSCDGRTLCTTSLDGSWILYDGVSGKAVHRVSEAHSKVPMTSVNYSRSGQILLTCGMDSVAKLWDLRRLVSGTSTSNSTPDVAAFGEPGKCNHRSIHAVFSHDESHVLMQDTSLLAVHAYSVYSEDTSYTLTTQPSVIQRSIAVSPFSNVVVTGGDDSRLRVWTPSWLPS